MGDVFALTNAPTNLQIGQAEFAQPNEGNRVALVDNRSGGESGTKSRERTSRSIGNQAVGIALNGPKDKSIGRSPGNPTFTFLAFLVLVFCLGCDPQYGKVVNKEFIAQHEETTTSAMPDGDGGIALESQTTTVDDAYFLVLTGTNSNGQNVEYKKQVSADEFVKTKIGQYWPPGEK